MDDSFVMESRRPEETRPPSSRVDPIARGMTRNRDVAIPADVVVYCKLKVISYLLARYVTHLHY